jgi:L-malate glycosyltransferase
LKVLLACELYYPSVGGVQEVMRQIAERLVAVGHDVTVATRHLPGRSARTHAGVYIEEFCINGNMVVGLQGAPDEIDRYRSYVLGQDYDILMIKAAQQWTFDALTPILKDIKKPKLFIPCGFSGLGDPRYATYFERMPEWLAQFDRVIFYASDYRDIRLARHAGLTNIEMLSNGADEREFDVTRDKSFRARYGIKKDAFLVMTVGSLTGFKGHEELAEAFAHCDFGARPASLLLIGNQALNESRQTYGAKHFVRRLLGRFRGAYPVPIEERLRRWISRINSMPNRHALLLDLPRSEVVQSYLNSDLFVLASKIEYSPLVLFEAAAAGLPFLSVPVGNAAEIARWTCAGEICPAPIDERGYTMPEVTNLARHIEALAAQRDRLATLSSNGRRAWKERYSWSAIFRRYEQVFQQCLRTTR